MYAAVVAIAPEMKGAMDSIAYQAKDDVDAARLLMLWCEEHPDVVERLTAGLMSPRPAATVEPSALLNTLALERAQFDGDVPEHRTGPLMGNAMPAVPVSTTARSPVAIGLMLRAASQAVKDEAARLTVHWQALVQGSTGTDLAVSDRPAEPAGYQAGKQAEIVAVGEPQADELLALSPAEQQELTWKMISTSQGRKSAAPVVADLIVQRLEKHGLICQVRDFDPSRRVRVLAQASWYYNMTGGGDTQSRFSFVDVAAQAIAERLRQEGVQGWLETSPIDTVDLRTVGWACRIVEEV